MKLLPNFAYRTSESELQFLFLMDGDGRHDGSSTELGIHVGY